MRKNVKQALQFINDFSESFDPFKIAESLNIDIRFVEMDETPLGHCSTILSDTVILFDTSLHESNLKFLICAHELFHAMNLQDIASYYSLNKFTKSKLEHEANEFAIELIKELFKQNNGFEASHYKQLSVYGVDEEMLDYL